ncbi:hypothetical protein [Alteribacillus bidgolensis]|uniref:Uncharacterized protein n=1 Tax=Alteribacillus bidgolensis TaxID=930129 RepID=A0A1G8RL33_9BACI|nr:hypothetical protein [Alteribacillus bidgolensis]SDJ17708.1 hypothetical protein SAMN05216352_1298 [Alteribacillus bidgolensis]
MRQILFAFVLTSVVYLTMGNLTTLAEENLTEEQIAEKFEEIDSTYDVNEELSEEDAEFIKKYANVTQPEETSVDMVQSSSQETSSETFYGTGSAPNSNESAAVLGTYTLNQGYISQSYKISMTAAMNSGTADKITNEHTHTAYGTVGSGGLLKVYSKNDSRSCSNEQSCYSYFSEDYSAHVVYYSQVIKSTIYHDGNRSFDVTVSGL